MKADGEGDLHFVTLLHRQGEGLGFLSAKANPGLRGMVCRSK